MIRVRLRAAVRVSKNSPARIAVCRTIAIAAITMKASTQPGMSKASALRNLRFPLVGFLAGVNGRRDRVLLAGHYFLAAFEQVFAAFAKLARLFLCVFLAFVCS